jgi:Cu2+-containing amine oxidase
MLDAPTTHSAHPLDPLDEDEIRTAVGAVQRDPRFRASLRFFAVTLLEPDKGRQYEASDRHAEVVMVDRQDGATSEVTVASMHPLDALVLHAVGWDDGQKVRPILHRASLAEMVVPYGDTGIGHRYGILCVHEEDYGILWKHVDMVSGPQRGSAVASLVVSSIATVGNYEYGFYWYFYLDGTMQLEVKLTGIMSTMAVANGSGDAGATPA